MPDAPYPTRWEADVALSDGGTVHIRLGHGPQADVVEVVDDGVGLAADAPASLGLEIVKTLVREDLRGRLEFRTTTQGTHVVVRVPHLTEGSETP